jgi:hypothetical protein
MGLEIDIHSPQTATIARIGILHTGSVTHAFNSDQRYVGLRFKHVDRDRLVVAPPPNGNITPPGFYLLFLIDVNGIPPEGKFIQIPNPNLFPEEATVGALFFLIGIGKNLTISPSPNVRLRTARFPT